jgi:hypothetical protein
VSKAEQRAWVQTPENWEDLTPPKWRPQKILDAGANGVYGLWWYVGRTPWAGPPGVVVKQAKVGSDAQRIEEAFMKRMMDATAAIGETEHIVKLYKDYHLDSGDRTSTALDPSQYSDNSQTDPGWRLAEHISWILQAGLGTQIE